MNGTCQAISVAIPNFVRGVINLSSSLTPPKPTACKGCGKPIIFEKQADGKWLVSEYDVDEGVRLEKHNCPSYKPKPRQEGGGWSGTNKQGQMFEARVSQDLQQAETRNNELILKMLTDISRKQEEQSNNMTKMFDIQLEHRMKQDEDRQKLEGIATNVLEILGLIQDQIIKKQEEEAPAREEPSTQSERTDYGF